MHGALDSATQQGWRGKYSIPFVDLSADLEVSTPYWAKDRLGVAPPTRRELSNGNAVYRSPQQIVNRHRLRQRDALDALLVDGGLDVGHGIERDVVLTDRGVDLDFYNYNTGLRQASAQECRQARGETRDARATIRVQQQQQQGGWIPG